MNVPPEILSRLDAIADKVGSTVEHFWPILVSQQINYGVGSLVGAFLCFVLSMVFGYLSYKIFCKVDLETDINDYGCTGRVLLSAIFTVVGLFTFIFTFVLLVAGLYLLLNPEFYALQQLMKML